MCLEYYPECGDAHLRHTELTESTAESDHQRTDSQSDNRQAPGMFGTVMGRNSSSPCR
jgi:hypothetical protein